MWWVDRVNAVVWYYGTMVCLGLNQKKFDTALSKPAQPFWMQHHNICLNIKIGFSIIAIGKINARGNNGR